MKLLKSILILSLIMCVGICVCNAGDLVKRRIKKNTIYQINVPRKIEVHNAFVINYITTMNMGEATLTGTIEVNSRYKVVELQADYYIFNKRKQFVRVTNLNLIKGNRPATFSFVYSYPLDFAKYKYELFSLMFILEKTQIHNI